MAGPCNPDPCNKNGASGEVCNAGNCNCGAAPCAIGVVCNSGRCGIYYKSNKPNSIIITELFTHFINRFVKNLINN